MNDNLQNPHLVLTTINSPTRAIVSLDDDAKRHGVKLLIMGDTKTPCDFSLKTGVYFSLADQQERYPSMCELLPKNHYTRKNIGYLEAIANGANLIQETDDDNFPCREFFDYPLLPLQVDVYLSEPWANVYSLFSDVRIWPRGLPLEFVRSSSNLHKCASVLSKGLIIQGLADENPDVDAVFRLICDLPVKFIKREPIALKPGSWCPFNSQNTIFQKDAFPLLYLPSKCSFRMTDIWRSFVAQRCLWELNEGVVFHSPSVWQERNEHNLMCDFEQEIQGYMLNDKIRIALESTVLNSKDITDNLLRCYEKLVQSDLLPKEELPILHQWCRQLDVFV